MNVFLLRMMLLLDNVLPEAQNSSAECNIKSKYVSYSVGLYLYANALALSMNANIKSKLNCKSEVPSGNHSSKILTAAAH